MGGTVGGGLLPHGVNTPVGNVFDGLLSEAERAQQLDQVEHDQV